MKWFPLLLATALPCLGSGIGTKVMDPQKITEIYISRSATTVLKFPTQFTGVYGTGLVTGKDKKKGNVQATIDSNQPVMALHALDNIGTDMTVLMNDQMFVFKLVVQDPPDIAITLESGTGAVAQGESHEVTPEEVVANRPRFADQTLLEIADRIKRAALCSGVQPQLYQGYKHKDNVNLPSDDGTVKTVVRAIHQLPEFDAIILEGYVENDGEGSLTFDAAHVGVAIDSVQHPVTFLECKRPIAAHSTAGFLVEVVGELDGSRAAYSIDNDYRLIINTGYHIKQAPAKPNKQ